MTSDDIGTQKGRQLSYREFRATAHKGVDEIYILDKYLFRHISIAGSYLLSFTRISPNAITLLSFLLAISAVWFFMDPTPIPLLIGCGLVFVYHYLDHVDGELARVYAKTRGYKSGIAGSYLDLLCHSFTVNLWLPALAFGLFLQTEQPLVMLLGIFAMPAMSNFSQYVGTYIFTTQLLKNPNLPESGAGRAAIESLTGRHRQAEAVQSGPFSRRGLFKLAKEIIGYPGMIFLVIIGVVCDVILGTIWGRLGVLSLLAFLHFANNARRMLAIARKFAQIS
jgi:phosphatidylglycerophosphate synthase